MPKEIMDEGHVARTLKRLAHEIIERHEDLSEVVLVGIKSRGEPIAKRLKRNISILAEQDILCCSMDFHTWRDDLTVMEDKPTYPYNFTNKIVVLCDDVLFRGRTVRAAMDGIMAHGRAKKIELLVLIDRGHRELPIKADYVGKNVPTSLQENVEVHLREIDGSENVLIC